MTDNKIQIELTEEQIKKLDLKEKSKRNKDDNKAVNENVFTRNTEE